MFDRVLNPPQQPLQDKVKALYDNSKMRKPFAGIHFN